MKVFACINDLCFEVDLRVDPEREGCFIAEVGGKELHLQLTERKPTSLTLAINNQIGFYEFEYAKGHLSEVVTDNRSYRALIKSPQQQKLEELLEQFGAGLGGTSTDTKVNAPMPGKILGLSVKAGENLELGQVVCVLEAMKMENEIPSTIEGKIRSLSVKVGDTVAAGDTILEIEPKV